MSDLKVNSVNGSVVTILNAPDLKMMEFVRVGEARLAAEVIGTTSERTTLQVYEDTTGLKVGESCEPSGEPLCALLGPGLLRNIFDGIERPLRALETLTGEFIGVGATASALDDEKLWDVTVLAAVGDSLSAGQIYATCKETESLEHRIMLPPDLSGTVVSVKPSGEYRINDAILTLEDDSGVRRELTLCQRWAIRTPRPTNGQIPISAPLISGQRVIDSIFPIAKGGTAAIPGGFGTGKTQTQHQLAKWCDADLIVYIGCGERGNEMTEVLEEFTRLTDPRTGRSIMERTILIANTSNMPVAAREASIYTGITLAEYYRDMGYDVAIMADSTSRWAEALREISGRLEEMPAEEGFPAYLPSRISQFYERAGMVNTLSGKRGSITIIGAVSPQGADFSEPVTQNTKRFVRCFWALDKALAYVRHYPAINWTDSYSEYAEDLEGWYTEHLGKEFLQQRQEIMSLLHEEDKLMEIVKLIGSDVLPDDQKLIIETGKLIRTGFLQQNAYHADDTYVPLEKQLKMMQVITHLYGLARNAVTGGLALSELLETGIFYEAAKMKYDIGNSNLEKFDELIRRIDDTVKGSVGK
ncbi:MAG: V-type ATP synthase subunit A [Oscillospiraceae bacterium]|jgi:V/A-type H+-transporting ATPase subunit A|nr:V-type ATP synthase subunit A [Oscillospiraceae bacterium]